jgi:S-DNA-T family DNA segregation ATPase FtsK/SpoIIIE
MQLAVTVVSPATGRQADVVIDANPETVVAEIAAELDGLMHGDGDGASAGGWVRVLRSPPPQAARHAGPGIPGYGSAPAAAARPAAPALFVGYHQVPGDMRLADSPIMDGSVVSIADPTGCRRPEPVGVAEIRVASGPAAGTLHRLAFGVADIGGPVHGDARAAEAADLVIADPAIPSAALRVQIDPRGCQVTPFDGVPVLLDRRPLNAPAQWRPGQQIGVGDTLLDLARYEPPDAALHQSEDGASLEFNRPPRLLPPRRAARFALPSPPGKPERRPVPILMAVVPIVLGVAMAYFLRQVYMLAMAAFSPVMLLGSYVSDRRGGRKSYTRQQAGYREHKARVERDARDAVDAERLRRRHDCPDPATVLSIASGPRRRLWERRRTDPDYLLLRAGTADLPSAVELTDPTQDEHRRRRFWLIPAAPVTISLAERAVVGVAAPADVARAAGRWLVAQIAALHSPADVQICVLTDTSGQAAWEWVRWLPHCRPAEGQNCAALIGNDAETVAGRIAELQAIITARQKALSDRNVERARFSRDIVVVFDGSRKLRSLPGAIGVLRDGAQVGVYSICLDADERLLPAECHAVIAARPDGRLVVQQMNSPAIGPVRPEYVTSAWSDRLARSIAPVRDVSGDDADAGLPEACRLLDVLGLEPPTAQAIAAWWNAEGRSTLAVIGACYDGPFGVDLRKDGPHALIAGTTGAGKSELLQTIIASLACVNRPDAMTFVLVDYKGGSAFKDCVQLPHVVGMVTDLDAHLTQRALTSLSAELTRRERILAAAGAKDISDYTAQLEREARGGDRADSLLAPMPRLLIVIDEFASLVRDLPDFVTGLVGLAQRGRSLGIHLILATQRPSGVVSPDIRANTNLRIALRVTDAGESTDVIEAPDAAHISRATPGRGYVRLGHASLVPFQAGRIGGKRPGVAAASRPWVRSLNWRGLGRPEPQPPSARMPADEEVTDLKLLVRQIARAATGLGIRSQHSPWLAPLPRTLLLRDLPASRSGLRGQVEAELPFGLIDLPGLQRQRPAVLHLGTFGHLMAAGAPRSGRSQLLRTIAASVAVSCSSADVHLFGIDCGNGALLPLADLPHCGAVVTRTQAERAARLLTRLAAELQRRQDLLAEGGYAGVTEQRAAAAPVDRLPHIIVLLDRWEGFTTTLGETGGGTLTDVITQILAEGASAGIHLVMTGDRSLLAGRIAAMCEDKLAFKLAEKDDYALIGLRPRTLPDDIPPGRAYRAGTGTETQVALLAPDPSGQGQAAALRHIAAWSAELDTGVPRSLRPFRVDVLPSRITFHDAWKLRPPAVAKRPLWGLAGVGGDELTALGPDLSDGMPAFIVAGPARSGRSALLASMTRSFLAGGAQVILVTPRSSPLRSLVSLPGVIRSFTGPDLGEEELSAAIASLTAPGVVVMDDADLLTDCDAGGELSKIITRGAGRSLALVLAGDPDILAGGFAGWPADARRARRGCLTGPQTLPEGELIGARLTHAHLGQPVRAGKALLNAVGDGTLTTITIPS